MLVFCKNKIIFISRGRLRNKSKAWSKQTTPVVAKQGEVRRESSAAGGERLEMQHVSPTTASVLHSCSIFSTQTCDLVMRATSDPVATRPSAQMAFSALASSSSRINCHPHACLATAAATAAPMPRCVNVAAHCRVVAAPIWPCRVCHCRRCFIQGGWEGRGRGGGHWE